MIWRRRGMRVFGGAGIVRHGDPNFIRPIGRGLALALLLALLGSSALAGSFDVLVTSGDASPDGNGNFVTFTAPALNDAGQVAFLSQLSGTEEEENQALYRASGNSLAAVAHKGVSMLGADLLTNFINNSPSINNLGTVSHEGEPASAPGKYVAFLGSGGPITTYLGVNSASPSGSNTLVSHSIPVINHSGVTAYRAFYTGPNFEVGIYSRTAAGVTTLRLEQGVSAPRGGSIDSISQSLPTINESAQLAVAASVFDGIFTRKSAIRLDGTTIVELARDGDMAEDGISTIGNILSNTFPLNDAGQLAFEATYSQPALSLRQGVFRVGNEGAILLTPGTLPGSATTATNMRVTSINNAGTVGFTTEFTGSGDLNSGVYLANAGTPTLVAFEDTLTPEGTKYFRRFVTESVALNEDGQLAFLAELSNTANGSQTGRGIFRYDPVDGLVQIVRTGQAFLGSTLSSVNFVGDFYAAMEPISTLRSPDPTFSGLNNSDQLAFAFSLANGDSGIAIWSEVATILYGDFNLDGEVDAADYTVWRNNFGDLTDADIHNLGDGVPGINDNDYNVWRQHYGESSFGGPGSGGFAPVDGSATSSVVPEPASALLALLGALVLAQLSRPARTAPGKRR